MGIAVFLDIRATVDHPVIRGIRGFLATLVIAVVGYLDTVGTLASLVAESLDGAGTPEAVSAVGVVIPEVGLPGIRVIRVAVSVVTPVPGSVVTRAIVELLDTAAVESLVGVVTADRELAVILVLV